MTTSFSRYAAPKKAPRRSRTWLAGCLQLLIWLIFRPSYWASYLQHIHPYSDHKRFDARTPRLIHPFLRLVIEGGILLPVLVNVLITGAVLNLVPSLVISANTLAIHLGISVGLALLIAVVGGYIVTDVRSGVEGTAAGVVLAIAASVAINLLTNLLLTDVVTLPEDTAQLLFLMLLGALVGLVIGLAAGLGYSASRGCSVVEWSDSLGLGFGLTLLLGLLVGVIFELVGGAIALDILHFVPGSAIGISFGLAFNLGLSVNLWRPLLTYPLFLPWQLLLYALDQYRLNPRQPNSKTSCLRWHPAFWDELQYLPLWGLKRHLTYVRRCNPRQSRTLQKRLRHTYQAWATRQLESP